MLADDMGLGKTLQALCVLQAPSLVVAPAGVLYNWQREVARFRPSLSVNLYHGPNRSLDEDAHITLTSYATLRNDVELLSARAWDTVVLDEAQNIKNSDSQAARAAFDLDARFRITLTGTPVENRLEELWSQFHFLNRGLLGGRPDFQERYAKPIMEGDGHAVERLRARIRPFLLRRLKREVARDLPPRTEVVLRCILGDRERELYDAIRAATQKDVIEQLQAGGSVLAALEALLRLRQACCHPQLLPGQVADGSSKLELLMRTLEEALAEGHKALVFSQWTSLLDLAEPQLERAGIAFCRLDGSTRDRGEVVDRFQDAAGPPVMLISLKAGGTGLNLTAADHVFLLDPWWNPAVEDQAADRAHRIGQDRPVLVQRIVAAETVEERMLELQEKKRALASAATGDPRGGGGITRDDLLALLS
jgi:SNF2 family DNA or RNA helicase